MVKGSVPNTADAVVVGAGAIGASVAHHLAAAGLGRVVLIEREAGPARGATGACAGGFRQQFSSARNLALSMASVPMILGFTAEHGLPLDLHQDGYLFCYRDEASWATACAAAAEQRAAGAKVDCVSPSEVAALRPGLSLDGLVGATYGPEDGIADPAGLTQGYLTLARRGGTRTCFGVEARTLQMTGDAVTGVETTAGVIATPVVVSATGPTAADLPATAGVDVPVTPLRRHVVVTGSFPGCPRRHTLVVEAATNFYFHREGRGVLMGMPATGERPGLSAPEPEDFLAGELLPEAIRVLPALAEAAVAAEWAGYYEMTPDAHPVLGPVSGLAGLWLANGFSGHGFQQAPIVGKLLAEWIVEGAPRSVDVSSLTLDRFTTGRLLAETQVV